VDGFGPLNEQVSYGYPRFPKVSNMEDISKPNPGKGREALSYSLPQWSVLSLSLIWVQRRRAKGIV